MVWQTRRVRETAEDVIDLNRVGGEGEFARRNHQALGYARLGMEIYFHFAFWICVSCQPRDGSKSFVEMFAGLSDCNLARIALGLTMPTIFARTAPLTKYISVGTD